MDLPENRFKRRLKAGEPQLGIWNTIPDPGVAEALAGAGYDYMVFDTEHTPVEVSSVQGLLQAASAYPVAPVVRPSVNDTALIKRHLDQGAQTLILPYIETVEAAEAAVRAVRYPVAGVRGVAAGHRGSRYGRIKDYHRRADAEMCLILQIETVKGLQAIDAIAGVEGVDGLFIGPADLAASMGHLGQPGHPEVREVILKTIARQRSRGMPVGILTLDEEFARACMAAGSLYTTIAVDLAVLVREVDATLRRFTGG